MKPVLHLLSFVLQTALRGTIFSRRVILCTVRFPSVLPARVLYQQLKAAALCWHRACISSRVDTNPSPKETANEENTIRFVHDVAGDGADCCFVSGKPANARAKCFRPFAQPDNSTTAHATGRSDCREYVFGEDIYRKDREIWG